jgi:acyl-coenzyme A thioesterase PaaI-like protein
MPAVLDLWKKTSALPLGSRIFSIAFSQKAPYFATIRPRFTVIESNRAELVIRKRRRVHNHIGTVHAIALCNLAELTAGLMVDASLPKGMRWIPKGMEVKYLAKATGTQHAVAKLAQAIVSAEAGYALPVNVQVRDTAGTVVFEARIDMWVSPVKRG